MPISFACPYCGEQHQVNELEGNRIDCRNCERNVTIRLKEEGTSQTVGIKKDNREYLKDVARYQKGILVCLLIQLALYAGFFVGPQKSRLVAAVGVTVVTLAILAGVVFVFLLVSKLQDTTLGVVMAIATLLPCMGLLVLLLVNQTATKELKKEGVRVGLLGADLSQV